MRFFTKDKKHIPITEQSYDELVEYGESAYNPEYKQPDSDREEELTAFADSQVDYESEDKEKRKQNKDYYNYYYELLVELLESGDISPDEFVDMEEKMEKYALNHNGNVDQDVTETIDKRTRLAFAQSQQKTNVGYTLKKVDEKNVKSEDKKEETRDSNTEKIQKPKTVTIGGQKYQIQPVSKTQKVTEKKQEVPEGLEYRINPRIHVEG